jgi:membrane protein YqaA with SNARE-associated domain
MWTIASCFVGATASGLLPWINAELMLLAVASGVTSLGDLLAVVVAVTAGQVTGKSALYWIARRTSAVVPAGRLASAVERCREAGQRRQQSTQMMMLLSAIFGLPPFYITTLAAAVMGVGFARFLVAAIVGRLLHFAAVALAPFAIHAWAW